MSKSITSHFGVEQAVFEALLQLGFSGDHRECAFSVIARYGEGQRVYHDHVHLQQALNAAIRIMDATGIDGADRAAAILTLAYHDAIYEIGSRSNEADSAALLLAEVHDRVSIEHRRLIAEGARIIRGTKHHMVCDAGEDWQSAVFDADLAILGCSAKEYDGYVKLVRTEYGPKVTDSEWQAGRAAFLRGMLARPVLFGLPVSAALWDRQAVLNLERELVSLGESGRTPIDVSGYSFTAGEVTEDAKGFWLATALEWPDLAVYGDSEEKALDEARGVLSDLILHRRKLGQPIPRPRHGSTEIG